jgi:hypothetical protein
VTAAPDLVSDRDSGAYRFGLEPHADELERYTVFVRFTYSPEPGDFVIEEIDVDAASAAAARTVAHAALDAHYDEGGRIQDVVHRPRGVMYL